MTNAETEVVWYLKRAAFWLRLGDEDSALNAMIMAAIRCNYLSPHLEAKHRGPIMSRLNKVRALARRAAA